MYHTSSDISTAARRPVISPLTSKTSIQCNINGSASSCYLPLRDKDNDGEMHSYLGVIFPTQGHLTQSDLWSLKLALIAVLWKLNHTNHPGEGYGQYLHTNTKQVLISNISFSLPKCMGEYFVITDATFTDIRKKITYSQWEAEKLPKKTLTPCAPPSHKSSSAPSTTTTTPAPRKRDRGVLSTSLKNKS